MSARRNEKNAATNGAMSFKNLQHHQEDEDDNDIFSDIAFVPPLKKTESTIKKDYNLTTSTSGVESEVVPTATCTKPMPTTSTKASTTASTNIPSSSNSSTLSSATTHFTDYIDELLAAVPAPKRPQLKTASEYAKSGLRWSSHQSTAKCETRSSGNSPLKTSGLSDLTNPLKEKSSESPNLASTQLVVDQSINDVRPGVLGVTLSQLKQKDVSSTHSDGVLPSFSMDTSTVDGKISQAVSTSESAPELRQRPRSSAISSSGNRHSFPNSGGSLLPIMREKSRKSESSTESDMLARFVVHAFILFGRHYVATSVVLIMLLFATLLPCPQALKYFMAGGFFSAIVCMFLFLKYVFVPLDEVGIPSKGSQTCQKGAPPSGNNESDAPSSSEPKLWSDMQTWIAQRREIASEPLHRQPRLQVSRGFSGVHEGWMHELDDYDPDKYHINLTFSVHLRLEGNSLILRRPKQRVPKRALWSEPLHFPVTFINSRSYELRGAEVSLQPIGLRKRQIWNKKYPIAIKLSASAVVAVMSSGLGPLGKANTEVAAPVTSVGIEKDAPPHMQGLPASTSNTTLSKAGIKRLIEDLDFEVVSADEASVVKLFLFARSDYEKEAWFRRLDAASKGITSHEQMFKSLVEEKNWRLNVPAVAGTLDANKHGATNSTADNSSNTAPLEVVFSNVLGKNNAQSLMESRMREIIYYLAPFVPENVVEAPCDPHMLALNALLRRVFWDFFRTDKWKNVVVHRIQSTLDRIKRPNFIEVLNIRELQMGNALPVILEMGTPYMDQSGLWMDVDVAYNSGFSLTICTRVNFLKQKHMKVNAEEAGRVPRSSKTTATADMSSTTPDDGEMDSDKLVNAFEESGSVELTQPSGSDDSGATSGESSTASEVDEDASTELSKQTKVKTGKTRKVLGLVQRITQSKGFKKFTDLRVISRGMDFVASKDIVLHVSVLYFRGKLSVNLRPPPSDRLWFGFHDTPFPTFKLKIQPSLGHKVVNVRFLCDWINGKFLEEIQRKIVLPNMVDVPIKLLDSDHPEDWGHSSDFVDFVPKS